MTQPKKDGIDDMAAVAVSFRNQRDHWRDLALRSIAFAHHTSECHHSHRIDGTGCICGLDRWRAEVAAAAESADRDRAR